jgi:hypothetical protein
MVWLTLTPTGDSHGYYNIHRTSALRRRLPSCLYNMQQLVLTTDIATIASTGIVTGKYVKHVGFATGVTVNTTAGDSPTIGEFTQPANTIITNIKIFCDTAPVIATGDIGYEVGTSSTGAQIVAAITDEILDGGTTVVVGNVTTTTLVATTQNAATAPISPQDASA